MKFDMFGKVNDVVVEKEKERIKMVFNNGYYYESTIEDLYDFFLKHITTAPPTTATGIIKK